MEAVSLVGGLLGLSFVSGMRLYSTVLALGLGIRFEYLTIPSSLHALNVFAETPILAVAGLVYTAEFVADKIPWVDTVWDALHTFIRPIGAALLASTAIGDVDPVFRLTAALFCGGVALSSHTAKAGTRIAVNHSPEPFSNIALSVAEDAVVVGGVWLAINHPIIALAIVVIALALIAFLIPKLFRMFFRQAVRVKNFIQMRFRKISAPPASR